jgi:tetratricopeptide (TPR) repeat protein
MKGKSMNRVIKFLMLMAMFLAVATTALCDKADDFSASGYLKMHKGDLDGAIADFTKAIELHPSPNAYRARGNAKQAKGDLDGAIADFAKEIELHPSPNAYRARGNARRAKGDLDGAIADFTTALQGYPGFVDAYHDRGDARQAKGDLDGANADFAKVAELEASAAAARERAGPTTDAQLMAILNRPGQVIQPIDHSVSQMSVELGNTNGQSAGTATISNDKNGLKIKLDLKNLPPGEHAVQLHQNAKCEAPAFTSAGEPDVISGGTNFTVKSDGTAKVTATGIFATMRINGWLVISVSDGQQRKTFLTLDPITIFRNGGKSLVIADPSGNAIACGEIKIPDDQLY